MLLTRMDRLNLRSCSRLAFDSRLETCTKSVSIVPIEHAFEKRHLFTHRIQIDFVNLFLCCIEIQCLLQNVIVMFEGRDCDLGVVLLTKKPLKRLLQLQTLATFSKKNYFGSTKLCCLYLRVQPSQMYHPSPTNREGLGCVYVFLIPLYPEGALNNT